ncbi:MAG: hypothetical protein ABR552_11030, partial [Actinomycetota bacterium]
IQLYMIHNATPTTKVVFITYEIDYIPAKTAHAIGIKNTKTIWMDAGGSCNWKTTTGATGSSLGCYTYGQGVNPIFNAQRGFGHADDGAFHGLNDPSINPSPFSIANNGGTSAKVCDYPLENCALFNSGNGISAQQGKAVTGTKVLGMGINIAGDHFGPCPAEAYAADSTLKPGTNCGVIVVMGGHLHPGGLRDEVSLVAGPNHTVPEKTIRPIHISDAVYWDHNNPSFAGGAPTSWDVSMTGTIGRPAGNGLAKDSWRILVAQGDSLLLNGEYDTEDGSSYDQMGIVMAWMYPGYDPAAIDPFAASTRLDAGWATGPTFPVLPPHDATHLLPGTQATCTPGTDGTGVTTLCLRGNVTHGSMTSREDHWDCSNPADPVDPAGPCPALPSLRRPLLSTTITMQGFTYGELDLHVAQSLGIPQVPVGTKLTFVNPDMSGLIWHTVTRCPAPCTGTTSANYPYTNGGTASENPDQLITGVTSMDFDSTILCVGLGCAPVDTSWTFAPSRPGIYTFWCRIHPDMRGVFQAT